MLVTMAELITTGKYTAKHIFLCFFTLNKIYRRVPTQRF